MVYKKNTVVTPSNKNIYKYVFHKKSECKPLIYAQSDDSGLRKVYGSRPGAGEICKVFFEFFKKNTRPLVVSINDFKIYSYHQFHALVFPGLCELMKDRIAHFPHPKI